VLNLTTTQAFELFAVILPCVSNVMPLPTLILAPLAFRTALTIRSVLKSRGTVKWRTANRGMHNLTIALALVLVATTLPCVAIVVPIPVLIITPLALRTTITRGSDLEVRGTTQGSTANGGVNNGPIAHALVLVASVFPHISRVVPLAMLVNASR